MNKLSFRPRALEITKPLPVYRSEELPDLPEYSAINRAVPQLPSGMDEEEECEHHLQRAIVTGLIIPTPEVSIMEDREAFERLYPANYKPPRQLIHMQPFSMEEDVPDYDIDSEDEKWLSKQKLDITPLKFEEMMDRLESNWTQNFASQNRKELLLKDDDELSIAIFDYWLSKRLAKQPQPLVPCVRTEANSRVLGGSGNANSDNNPYLAFRRRTEKMQTRKNRKNDEMSYEKMVKLRRDLSRALQLLDLVKRRESAKKELLKLSIQLYEKRYEANDFSGSLLNEVSTFKTVRPAFAPIYSNQYNSSTHNHHAPSWPLKPPKEDLNTVRKEKRQYKKRKHKGGTSSSSVGPTANSTASGGGAVSSAEEDVESPVSPQLAFPFHRTPLTTYHAAVKGGGIGNWNWTSPEEGGAGEERYRFSLATLSFPKPTCVGLVRRRVGRGGRVILDRAGPSMDDFWSSLDFKIQDSASSRPKPPIPCSRYYKPKPPCDPSPAVTETEDDLKSGSICLTVESLTDCESTTVELDLGELFPDLEIPSSGSAANMVIDPPPETGSSRFLLDPTAALAERLQPPPPVTTQNGPTNHSDYGGSGIWNSSGCKWSNSVPGNGTANSSPVHLNTKYASRTSTTSQLNSESSEVHKRSGAIEAVVHTQPMEVA